MESSEFSHNSSRFEAIERIGLQGGTCDTYRVKLFGKLHFLKRLKPYYAADIRYQEALRKEFETGYRLEHHGLVRYISLADDGILMEYVDGETLAQRLHQQPLYFDKKNTRKFLDQLLDVVGYLHAHQVLHLDLKPDNIMLTRIGNDVKLIDLGGCYTDTFTDTPGYTTRFAAPEQLRGGTTNERTDIYAIGKILELLPGHHIYNKVIARCTAANPEARYRSIHALREALFPHHRRWQWLLAAFLLAALLVGIALFTHRKLSSPEVMPSATEPEVVESEKTEEKRETVRVAEAIITTPEELRETVRVTETIIATPEEKHDHGRVAEAATATPEVQRETFRAAETTTAIPEAKQEKEIGKPQRSASTALGPAKSTYTEEEIAFLNRPDLKIASNDEFTRYKRQLDKYYKEANDFLNDKDNFRRYPSHVAYMSRYQDIIHQTLQRIKADKQFYNFYISPMNPVSSYTRKYKDDLEHRAFVNGNKLP